MITSKEIGNPKNDIEVIKDTLFSSEERKTVSDEEIIRLAKEIKNKYPKMMEELAK